MELKPCPFCGVVPEHVVSNGCDNEYVECGNCGASGPPSTTQEHAREIWNDQAMAPSLGLAVMVSGMASVPSEGGGRGTWQKRERGAARFHGFGADYEEFETGPGNFTAAIIEWADGKIELVRADMIQFTNTHEAAQ